MTAKIQFRTKQTRYGLLHTMRLTQSAPSGAVTNETDYRLFPARPQGVAWAGPVYLATNGTGWRIGRCKSGALIAWKSLKMTKRFGLEGYRMRSVPGGYKGDYVTSWSRAFNGRTYSFSRIFWNAGQDGVTLRVYKGQTTELLKEFRVAGPVKMK